MDIYICNNQRLIEYMEKLIRVKGSIANGISPGKRKVKIWPVIKNGLKSLVLTLTNIFYLPYSPSNLISLGFLNYARIYHHNEKQIFHNQSTQKTLAFVKKYKTNFFLHPLNLSSIVVNFFRENKVYKRSIMN